MAEEVGTGVVKIEPDTDGLGRKIAQGVNGQSSVITRAFSGVGKLAGAAFKATAVAGAAVLAGGVVLAKTSIDAASDQAEALSKVSVVFGDASKDVVAWADTSATAFGQSKASALEAAGTYGNLFQAFGVGQKPAQEMSQSLVELAADLASFNNTSVDDALLALRSGLSGETEPLKRYGVALSEVRLKEQALAMGLISSTKDALTPAAKAQASYALIMQDTALAQGDFERTSDGLANKQRILSAQWKDIQARIGQVLIPAFLAVVTAISTKLIPAIGKTVEWMREHLGPVVSRVFGQIREWVSTAVDWIVEHWPEIQDVFGAVVSKIVDLWTNDLQPVFVAIGEGIKTAFLWVMDNQPVLIGILVGLTAVIATLFVTWAIGAATAAAATLAAAAPFIAIGVAVAAVAAAVIYAYQNWEWFRTAVDAVASWLTETFWPALVTVFGWLRDNVPPILQAVASFLVDYVWPALQKVWDVIVNYIWPAFLLWAETMVTVYRTAIETAITVITTLWGWLQTLWDRSEGLRGFLATLFVAAFDLVKQAVENVRTVVETLWSWIQTAWDRLEPFRSFLAAAFWLALTIVRTAFDNIVTAITSAWNWLQSLWDKSEGLRGFLADVFGLALDGVRLAFDAVADAVGTIVDAIQAVIDKANAALGPLRTVIDLMNKINPFGGDITGKVDPNAFKVPAGNASGGRIPPFTTRLVGEKGPEYLTLGSVAGYVTPNHRLASSSVGEALASSSAPPRSGPVATFGDVYITDTADLDGFARELTFTLAGV